MQGNLEDPTLNMVAFLPFFTYVGNWVLGIELKVGNFELVWV